MSLKSETLAHYQRLLKCATRLETLDYPEDSQ
jgi:hypothetical protein